MKERFPDGLAEIFPRARVLFTEGGHHFPMADDPVGLARAIRSWWRDEVETA